MNIPRISSLALFAFASLSMATSPAFADTIQVSYLAPGVQAPTQSDNQAVYYDTFGTTASTGDTTLATTFGGSSISGTYTGNFNIAPADNVGGAGRTGEYLQVTSGNSVTVTVNTSVNFFGLWLSALDSGNEMQFYNDNTLLYSFNAQDFINLLGPCPNASDGFCNNPNGNYGDPNEQFAYLNFLDLDGSFNKVVLTELPIPANFEADNISVAVQGTSTGTVITATPEPSSLALFGTGLTAIAGVIRRRRR